MNEVRLDPQQVPARAELLLAADFGREARGRPIYGRLESEDDGAGEPGPRLKIGAVRTRRLAASEGTARPSGSVYGNPLRGTRDDAPAVPIGAPAVARRPGDRAAERPGEAPVAGGSAAVAARPRAERRPRMTSPPAATSTHAPAGAAKRDPPDSPTPCTGTPRTTPPSRPS